MKFKLAATLASPIGEDNIDMRRRLGDAELRFVRLGDTDLRFCPPRRCGPTLLSVSEIRTYAWAEATRISAKRMFGFSRCMTLSSHSDCSSTTSYPN